MPIAAAVRALVPALVLLPALGACGTERAVRAEITVGVEGDTLCVAAGDGTSPAFVGAYEVATLPDPATLTLVPGPRTGAGLYVAAFVTDGGAVRGRAANVVVPPAGVSSARLAVRRCTPGAPGGFGARAGGTFAALATPPRMIAVDFDGDGADELAAIAADSRMVVLDAIDPDAGSRSATELVTDGRLAAIGDLDGDCRLDLVAAASLGALVVEGETGRSLAPLGPSVVAAAFGGVRRAGEAGIVLAGGTGLDLVTRPGATPAVAHLADGEFAFVATGRLDGDAENDLLASGPAGTVLFLGGSPPTPIATLPGDVATGTGPVAFGDVDGDGRTDAVVAVAAAVSIVLGDGAGDFAGTIGTTLDADIVRIELADLDGDCTDDVVALTTSGRVAAVTGAGGTVADLGAPAGASTDVTVLDADGDGTTEVALLGAGGRVTLWRP